jgi:photosystem II stability/assembly factor-like uncharacterized protein
MMVQELPERRAILQQGSAAGLAASLSTLTPGAALAAKDLGVWKQVDLPIVTEAPILFDIEFDPANPKNGWIVGNRGTFLQTTNGGAPQLPATNCGPGAHVSLHRRVHIHFAHSSC